MKFRKYIITFILILALFSPVLAGCELSLSPAYQLRTPVITMHEDDRCLTWKDVAGADSYDIYINSQLIDNIDDTEESSSFYDFANNLSKSGKYEFYIIAKSNKETIDDSEPSNVVSLEYEEEELITPEIPEEIVSDVKIQFSISENISENILTYTPLEEDVDNYVMYLYSNTTGLNDFVLSKNNISLRVVSDVDSVTNQPSKGIYYLQKDDIYAIRMGYKKDEKIQIASDIKYYNSDKYAPYTNNIYLFDGYINDYYIENLQEFKNLVYYSFINRLTDYTFKISPAFRSTIMGVSGGNFDYKLDVVAKSCYNSFLETMCMGYVLNGDRFVEFVQGSENVYKIKLTFFGVEECDTSIKPMQEDLYKQLDKTQYYETVAYETRADKYGENYNNFVSDKHFLYTNVYTSEQLYWAVENKVTPIIKSDDSRAYQVYTEAKRVLNNIISDDMTDYEKALSIFDWISVKTQYDHTSLKEDESDNPQKNPCYYLEGVFLTGYAVCDGFSKAYSLMCNMIGIDCIRIVGTAKTQSGSGGHAWNKVKIDKDPLDNIPAKYYLVDITWSEVAGDSQEIPFHSYFLLSDNDVKDTHFYYNGRENKFKNYKSEESFEHYEYFTYTHKGETKNLVIDEYVDLKSAFDYLLINSYESIEIVVDIDFMIDVYENEVGSYKPLTDIGYSNLMNVFITKAMKSSKFSEQFLLIKNNRSLIKYNESGCYGIVFVIEQYLLIDESADVVHLVDYFDDNNITGTYLLYVDNNILGNQSGSSLLDKVKSLFSCSAGTGLKISFELYDQNVNYSDDNKGAYYKVVITQDLISEI